jgi:hypothetical protein
MSLGGEEERSGKVGKLEREEGRERMKSGKTVVVVCARKWQKSGVDKVEPNLHM